MEQFIIYIENPKYLIGSLGTIKTIPYSNRRKKKTYISKIRPHLISTSGYPIVSINSKQYSVHRLIAMHFIQNPDNKKEVNHKNGIRTDFRIENLEWVTRKENQIHSWRELNRKPTWAGKTGYSHHSGKPVNQFDIDGNLITQYGSSANASESNGYHRYTIDWAIKTKAGYYKGNYWAYAN